MHYRHTQVGWVIIGVVAALGALVLPRLPGAGGPLLPILALVLLLFSTLTVEVDREFVRLRFGIGLIRKRLPLDEVRAWQAVRNPWYCGWGIRLGPGWVMWNASGYDAVELVLADGRRFRIGTDEPAELVAALERTSGRSGAMAPPSDGAAPAAPRGPTAWRLLLLVGLILVVVLGAIFYLQMRPVKTTVAAAGLTVETLFYGTTFAAADITAISLVPSMPRVLIRTNGFAAAGILRGHFEVEGLGRGRLFVDAGSTPYVFVRLGEGFAFVNHPDPQDTRALYEELARVFPGRVGPASP